MSKQRIIVVLGMHRSGTSAIARGLKALSVDLGDHLMPGVEGENEKGFWEDLDIYHLNERLLAKVESAWDRASPIDTTVFLQDDFAQERYDAAKLIELKTSRSGTFGFKDPRTCITLPFWRVIFEDLGVEDSYVLALRNPLEVAESLRRRNGLDPIHSLSIWLKYNWSAVVAAGDRPLVCVSFEHLIRNPVHELSRIAAKLDLEAPLPSTPGVIEYVSDFLAPELRRQNISNRELARASWVPQAVRSLYEEISTLADSDHDVHIPPELKSNVESFFSIGQPLLLLSDRERTLSNTRLEAIRLLEAARKDAHSTIETLEHEVARFREQAAAAAEKFSSLKAAHEQNEVRIKSIVESERAALEELREAHRTGRTDLERLERAESDNIILRSKSDELESEKAKADQLAIALESEVKETKRKLDLAQTRLLETETELNHLKDVEKELRRTLDVDQARLFESEAEIRELNKRYKLLVNKESSARADLERQYAELLRKDEHLIEQIEKLRGQVRASDSSIQQLQSQLSKREAEIAERDRQSASQATTIRLLRSEALAVRQSKSWKVTEPLRKARAMLTRVRAIFNRILGR